MGEGTHIVTGQGNWSGRRVTVMGLGVLGGGVGAARYLASHGARVTVTDMRDEEALASSIDQLADLPITYHLGGHDLNDFRSVGADVVVRNPGVPMDSDYLAAAMESGVDVEMEMSIFFRDCPAPIIGITGTKGKTTVSALIGTMLKAWRPDALLAGNMGLSALLELDRLQADTPVALELSSFQIEALNEHHLVPQVAVLTNIFPDHLDRYRDFEHYAATKRGMTWSMTSDQVVVYNADDPQTTRLVDETEATLLPFGIGQDRGEGAWLVGDELVVNWDGHAGRFPRPDLLSLAGDHGARNALAAIAACVAYGVPADAIRAGLKSFRGVENRLEVVRVLDDVTWVNDTSATAPAAAVAGIRVLAPRAKTLHIIAGGADKKTDLDPLADELATHHATVYLLDGTATADLASLLEVREVKYSGPFGSMQEAISAIDAAVEPGDVVALCPGCASFGMFRNEFDRGSRFRAAVADLTPRSALQEVQS